MPCAAHHRYLNASAESVSNRPPSKRKGAHITHELQCGYDVVLGNDSFFLEIFSVDASKRLGDSFVCAAPVSLIDRQLAKRM